MIRPSARPVAFMAALALAAFSLSACDSPRDPAEAGGTQPVDPPAATGPVQPETQPALTLTAHGFGPVHVGMRMAELEAAMGPPAHALDNPIEQCNELRPQRAPQGLYVMVENGLVTRVTLGEGSSAVSERGIRVGDTAARVREVYGSAIEASGHKYEPAPAEYLTTWATPDHSSPAARGIKYEIGQDGTVRSISGGGPSIQYVEGCS